MRKKINEFKETLHGFIDQGDDLCLVVSAADTDMPLVFKVIESVDQEQPADIVLSFAHSATTSPEYVAGVMTNVDVQIEGVNALRLSEGLPAWPKLPPACHDNTQPEKARILGAMRHVRGFFPANEDHRIVWCFLPAAIGDKMAYAKVMVELLPARGIEPWMHSQRILMREDSATPYFVPFLHEHKVQGTLIYRVDFSRDAMLQAMAEEAEDPETPAPQRMQTLLQLAAVDASHQRPQDAMEKYAVCYEYYLTQNQPVPQSMCLEGVGDVMARNNQVDVAKGRYQQALALSSKAGPTGLPVVMIQASKAGDMCMLRSEYEEAEGYHDLASQIAGKLVNLEFKVDNMEKVGVARVAQGKNAGAAEIWNNGIGLCKEGDYFMRWRTIAERLVALHTLRGSQSQLHAAEGELAAAERACRERYG